MRPLRVTFVVPDLAAGGAERHVTTLVEHLDPARVQARVVCLGEQGALFADAAAWVPATAYGHSKRQMLRSVWRLARELRATRTDVVVLRGYSAEIVGRLAAVLARVPHRVIWVHNSSDLGERGRVRALSDRVLGPVTSAWFGVAEQQRGYLTGELGFPAERVHIIYNGVDPALHRPAADGAVRDRVRAGLGLADDEVAIGILAAMRPEKDHATLLRAAARVVAEDERARFVLVGDGALRPDLERQAVQLGLGDRVVFAGYRSDVSDVLEALDVFVLSSWSECLPMSVLEAMASGRPVVCTDVGGIPEVVEEGRSGFLVPPRDEVRLAGRLLELVRSPELRHGLGTRGRERIEADFTLARSVRETERVLLQIAGGAADDDARTRPVELTVVMDETGVGGVEVVTLKMFSAFDPAVVTPRLVCLREEGSLGEDYRAAGFDVVALHRTSKFDLRTLPRLVRQLRRWRTDVVLVSHHHRASLVLGRVAARLAGARASVVAAHGMDLVPLGHRVLPRSTVQTLRWASALVMLAPSQADYLHRLEGVGRSWSSRTREVVIANGIPLPPAPSPADRSQARALLGLDEHAFVAGIVARLAKDKGHHVLLEAFARVVAVHPTARLVVVGSGDRDAFLRQQAVDLGLEQAVLFTGVRRDVARLMPAFDVACLPSVHEAAPITIIEAMAAAVPVVASRVGAIPDLVGDGREGLLVPVGDSAALAGALLELAEDPDRRGEMGAAARLRAERDFTIEGTARGYEQLVKELVQR